MIPTSIKKPISKLQCVALIFVILTLLIIGKDLMHSYIRNYSFYLSESLLFGTFWLIFIPFLTLIKTLLKKINKFILPLTLSFFHIGLFSSVVFLISALFFNNTFQFYQTFTNTTAQYGIVCLIIYSISSYYFLDTKSTSKVAKRNSISDKIKVTYHNKVVILDLKDILYVKSEKPYIAFVTKERTYLKQSSLKTFLGKKATQDFIQIHKSTIVNTKCILSYTSRKNGDYDIELTNNESVRASRNFSTNFKPFFDSITLE